jgi:DNA-binding response OmpR family regulator
MTKEIVIKLSNIINEFDKVKNDLNSLLLEINSTNTIDKSGLKLNKIDFSVEFEGKKINLTRMKYKIVEFLLINNPCIMKRSDIYKHMFPNEQEIYDGYTSVIAKHIYDINKLAREMFGRKIISNRSGHGYFIS